MQGNFLALSGAQKLSVCTAHKAPRSTKSQKQEKRDLDWE